MENAISWAGCDLVEVIEGKQNGVPLFKGTRVPAQQIVEEHELGSPIDEIVENYPTLTRHKITALIAFAERFKSQPVP